MKYVALTLLLTIFIVSCNSNQSAMRGDSQMAVANDTVRIANDDLEYEIIIIEPGFNSWLITQPNEEYYSLSSLENKNAFSVAEYNRRVINPDFSRELYQQQINYENHISYGMEVNYLLFQYFRYFEQTYGQKL